MGTRRRFPAEFKAKVALEVIKGHETVADWSNMAARGKGSGRGTVARYEVGHELDIDIVLTAYGLTEAAGFGTMCRADDDAVDDHHQAQLAWGSSDGAQQPELALPALIAELKNPDPTARELAIRALPMCSHAVS